MTGNEQYRISSYNRTAKKFIVLIYSSGANGKGWADISIPATIQNGKYYNNDDSTFDFRGEGIREGQKYTAKITTQEINRTDGSDQNLAQNTISNQTVKNGILKARINGMKKFTKIEFSR